MDERVSGYEQNGKKHGDTALPSACHLYLGGGSFGHPHHMDDRGLSEDIDGT